MGLAKRYRRKVLALAAAASSAIPTLANADVIDATWLGGTGSWNDPTQWSGGVVPNNTATTTFRAFIPSGSVTAGGAANTITIDSLNLNGASTLLINNAGFNLLSGEINGDLTIRTSMRSGPLTGSGAIAVGDGSGLGTLFGDGAVDIGAGLNVEIKKYSGIGGGSPPFNVPFINRGHIVGGVVDWSFAPYIAGGSIQNLGTLEARNGALSIGGGATFTQADLGNLLWTQGGVFAIAGTLLNHGQTLNVDASQGWAVVGGTIQGGTLDIDPGTRMVFGGEFAASALDGVVVNGPVRVINRDLNITNGTLAGNADLLLLTQYIAPPPRVVTSSSTLTIEPTVTIRGGDSLGSGVGDGLSAIVNHGTIRSEVSAFSPARLNVLGTSVFNDGRLSVSGDSFLVVSGVSSSSTSLSFGNGGILDIELNVDPQFGLLQLRGPLDLSTFFDELVLRSGPAIQTGTFYRIVSSTDGITGVFDSVTPGFDVQYLGNDIYAALIPEPMTIWAIGLAGLALRRRHQ